MAGGDDDDDDDDGDDGSGGGDDDDEWGQGKVELRSGRFDVDTLRDSFTPIN